MVKGIGVDIVNLDRFENINIDRDFVNQILNDYEISVVLTRKPKYVQVAKAFALKEATMKALGTGLHYGSYWHNIEISDFWEIKLSGYLKEVSDKMKVNKIYNSFTQTKNYVTAVVILED
jgi:holo-[acyl-carrier protein] synthase